MSAIAERRVGARKSPQPILDVAVQSLRWPEAIGLLKRLLAERRFTRVGFLNAHNSNIARGNPEYAQALHTFLILPDGIGVDLASKILHGAAFPDNLNGTDLIPAFLQAVEEPLRVAIIGARLSSAEGAARVLGEMAPQHRFFVVSDGFYKPEEEAAVVARIAAEKPDVLLVALGVPRQELFIARHITPAHCAMPIAVGALIDFLSGAVPRAPAFWRRMRLEWLYRFLTEPRRLWRRYLVGNPVFVGRVLRKKFGKTAQRG